MLSRLHPPCLSPLIHEISLLFCSDTIDNERDKKQAKSIRRKEKFEKECFLVLDHHSTNLITRFFFCVKFLLLAVY